MEEKRSIEICVISDVHLGTIGCHAIELQEYLKSISPEILILNGDIIDIWNFKSYYFPKQHMKVIRTILKMAERGTKVYYLTGNHDEILRNYSDMQLGNISLRDKLIMEIGDKKYWFFHGDIFDISTTHSKWLTSFGGWVYDYLVILNRLVNNFLERTGRPKISLAKKIKENISAAQKHIENFENTICDVAIQEEYDYVVCGHIHEPKIKEYNSKKGEVIYLNSGDWIEHLTSLEYNGSWKIHSFNKEIREFDRELKSTRIKVG